MAGVRVCGRHERRLAIADQDFDCHEHLRGSTCMGAFPLDLTSVVERCAVSARKTSWFRFCRVSTVHLGEFTLHARAPEPVRLSEDPDRDAPDATRHNEVKVHGDRRTIP